MTTTEKIQLATFLVAIITAYVGLQTFRRNKKLELENQLFKLRLDAFSNIAFEIDNFFMCLNRAIVKLNDTTELDVNGKKERLKALSYEVDEQTYKCHTLIAKHSVYFSQVSIESLFAFTNNLLGKDTEGEEIDLVDWIVNYYNEQTEFADAAITQLREELQLEKLHYSLYMRSRK